MLLLRVRPEGGFKNWNRKPDLPKHNSHSCYRKPDLPKHNSHSCYRNRNIFSDIPQNQLQLLKNLNEQGQLPPPPLGKFQFCMFKLTQTKDNLEIRYDRKGFLITGTRNQICRNTIPVLVTGNRIYFLTSQFWFLFRFRLNRNRK